jgi:hypothetical protein
MGANADKLLRDAAALSEPRVKERMHEFLAGSREYKDLRSSWLREEVQTEEGIGIISCGIYSYSPVYDLKTAVVRLADLIASDRYQPIDVEIASELPFDERTRGVARILAPLRPGEHPEHHAYELEAFLAEVDDESAAQRLRRGVAQASSTSHTAMAAIADSRSLCLLVARCRVAHLVGIETPESVARFSEKISEILQQCTSSPTKGE